MAGKIITVAQQKGGAGKTTLTAHLAVAWRQAGMRVGLVDIDPQGSLTRWYETRTKALGVDTGFTHSQINGWRTQKEVERLARDNDVVVIDSPPHAETEARIAVRVASMVIVPVQPSPMDLWATQPTIELGRLEKVRILLVLNRMPPRSKLTEAMVVEINGMVSAPTGALAAVALADARIGNRISYAGALLSGRAVTETDGNSKAAVEMSALAAEIMRRIG